MSTLSSSQPAADAASLTGRRARRVGRGSRAGAIGRRLITMLAALALVLVGSFALIHLIPGDPATRIAGIHATPDVVAGIRAQLGLDKPLTTQFADYVSGLARGELGTSFTQDVPVADIITSRLPKTLQLAGLSFLITIVMSVAIGLSVGILTREGRHRRLDAAFTGFSSLIHAIPDYLLATFLVFVFAVTLKWLPVAGSEGASSIVLPALGVALAPMMVLARLTRVETRRVLGLDYVRTARAKRLPAARIYLVHVLPNVLTSTLTVGGLVLTSLIGGTVIVENVFAWPGLGTEIVRAISQRDYPVIQASVLFIGTLIIVVNALVDILIAMLDPRSAIGED